MDSPASLTLNPERLYERQRALGLRQPTDVTVVGLGGTGAWVALFLALSGVTHFTLLDADRVEAHNLNRLPFDPASLGQPKVTAAAALLTRLRPNVQVTELPLAWHPGLPLHGVVWDCTDSPATQAALFKAVSEQHLGRASVFYVRAGCGANEITATRQVPTWGTAPAPGYGPQGEPIWVGPAALAAIRAVGCVLAGWPQVSGAIQ